MTGPAWRAAALAAALACGPALAQNAAGRALAARTCTPCHGPLGISVQPNAPNLAGQPRMYLVEQLLAYRSGKRANEVMNVVARPLTDVQIAELADWFSSIPVEARPPPGAK